MPKRDPFNLTTDSRGNFKRTIGVKRSDDEYKPATFYLGRDRAKACINVLRLEEVWQEVHDEWYKTGDRSDSRACWDSTTLAIGKAVAMGEESVQVDGPYADIPQEFQKFSLERMLQGEGGGPPAEWLTYFANRFDSLNKRFGRFIRIEMAQENWQEIVLRARYASEVRRTEAEPAAQMKSSQTLAQALDGFVDHIRLKYKEGDGTTLHGKAVLNRIDFLRRELGNDVKRSLDDVNLSFLDNWLMAWKNRPKTAKGEMCSPETAKQVIKVIRYFVKWLHRSSDFSWTKPADYEVTPVTIRETPEELARSEKIVRYRTEELSTLWEYAGPRERVYMLLGLNCGFGKREVSTLRIDQIDLEKGAIHRRRTKTGIWGLWKLWPETVAGLRWYLEEVRGDFDSPYVFVSDRGKPFAEKTKGGNPNMCVANAWDRLNKTVRKDFSDFRWLTFNKLRKTGASWMRRRYGKEIAEVYLSHGEWSEVDHYTDRRFQELRKALGRLRKCLEGMFAKVETPFNGTRKPNTTISLATQKRIRELRRQGYTLRKTAELAGVTFSAARRYGKV